MVGENRSVIYKIDTQKGALFFVDKNDNGVFDPAFDPIAFDDQTTDNTDSLIIAIERLKTLGIHLDQLIGARFSSLQHYTACLQKVQPTNLTKSCDIILLEQAEPEDEKNFTKYEGLIEALAGLRELVNQGNLKILDSESEFSESVDEQLEAKIKKTELTKEERTRLTDELFDIYKLAYEKAIQKAEEYAWEPDQFGEMGGALLLAEYFASKACIAFSISMNAGPAVKAHYRRRYEQAMEQAEQLVQTATRETIPDISAKIDALLGAAGDLAQKASAFDVFYARQQPILKKLDEIKAYSGSP